MNIPNIQQQISLLHSAGCTLNIDERFKLKLAHIQIMEKKSCLDEAKFWGKIQTLTKNYYIFMGLQYRQCYEFPHKYFFWASNDFQFKEIPALQQQHKDLPSKFNTFFTGDPNKVLVTLVEEADGNANQPDPENQNEKKQLDEEEEVVKIQKKNFTQLDRLAYVVNAIENDVQCVPRGTYKMTPQHELTPVLNFQGLDENCWNDLGKWVHFRAPQTAEGRAKIESENVVFIDDFLDDLSGDQPKGVWSIKKDCQGKNVVCSNMLWEGYSSVHRLKTEIFGSIYIGNGIKNIDVAFMI